MAPGFHITLHRIFIFMFIVSGIGILLAAGVDLLSSLSFLFTNTPPIVDFFDHTLFSFKVRSISLLPKILGMGTSGQQSSVNVSFGQIFIPIFLIMFLLSVVLRVRNSGQRNYEVAVLRMDKVRRKEVPQSRLKTYTIANDVKPLVKRSRRRSR